MTEIITGSITLHNVGVTQLLPCLDKLSEVLKVVVQSLQVNGQVPEEIDTFLNFRFATSPEVSPRITLTATFSKL